ncbi:MAG: SF1B family DNA helicase RecD2 [Bacillota bacterium]
MTTIEGTVEKINFTNEETLYTVARLALPGGGSTVTFVGNFAKLSVGERVRLTGEWVVHPEYGRQLQVESYEALPPTTPKGIERYLGSGLIKGIGPATAKRLVAAFGEDTLKVIEEHPERLRSVEGVGQIKAERIVASLADQRELKEVMVFLQGHEISPGLAMRLHRQYGRRTIEVIRENPYRLADEVFGVGFKTADKIARQLGMAPDDPNRLDAGLRYALAEATGEGHVYLPADQLWRRAAELLEAPKAELEASLGRLASSGEVTIEGQDIFLASLHRAEVGLAERLRLLDQAAAVPIAAEERVTKEIAASLAGGGPALGDEQQQAVAMAMSSGVTVITGGPGTGKTTVINTVLDLFERFGRRVVLCAPTGRAAKRMTEATGREAGTVHRTLEYRYAPGQGLSFARNEDNPLEDDAVVVDEASMLDLSLCHHLARAVRPGARLILVGDVDQLPAVGPGNVLRDVIASGAFAVARLTRIYRQAGESLIVLNAHRINAGEPPELNRRDGDFFFIEEEDPEKIRAEMIQLVTRRLADFRGFDPIRDIQVLSPMHRTPVGVEVLNRELQERLNPAPEGAERAAGPARFRPGDKVMQVRNDYQKGVFNGDIGWVVAVDDEEGEVTVSFPESDVERQVIYDRGELDELTLAYAISVHKSQGSEYRAVVMPLTTQHYVMLQRNLLYTAITRARELVVLVGTRKALSVALHNDQIQRRFTRLKERLAVGGASPRGAGGPAQ